MKIIDDLKNDLELFESDMEKHGYSNKVKEISKELGLDINKKTELRYDYMPTYYTGKLEKNKIILMSLNPGFNEKQNKIEENKKKEDYFKFIDNFFKEFPKFSHSKYYTVLAPLFGKICQKNIESREEIYSMYQDNLINIDLIPYHSNKFSLSEKVLNSSNYLKNRISRISEYMEEIKPKLIVFNGAVYKKLLFLSDLKKTEIKINDKVNMYMFLYGESKIPAVYFNKSINQPFCKVTKQMKTNIMAPKIIKFIESLHKN